MSKLRDSWFVIIISLIVLLLVSIPYFLAERASGTDFVFNGFLLNPFDGNTYLAKMYQGWQGNWRFKLPYTADPGEGAYLFLFYLALGHLARLANLPNLVVFHLVRLLGTLFLLLTMWCFFSTLFSTSRPRKFAFALAALGSGMGWLLVVSGALTSDFWVAEAYPFLSSYANPHFPISLSLMLWLLMPSLDNQPQNWRFAIWGGVSFLLSVISPFGVVVVLMVLGGEFLLRWYQKRWSWSSFWRIFWIALLGLPMMIYDLWAVAVDPILAGWNDQNLTPSPPIWDLLISILPALLLAGVGVWGMAYWRKQGKTPDVGLPKNWSPILIWVGLGLLLMYLPWSLQRRFIIGLYVPLAGLAAIGLEMLAKDRSRRYRFLVTIIFFLAVPTNMIVLLAGFQATRMHDSQIYLSKPEHLALSWIEENTSSDDLVLASPEMGLFVPAYTGRQVIYGHPFETVNADKQEQAVTSFYSGELSETQMQDYLIDQGVDFIFMGPRESALGLISIPNSWELAFRVDGVNIYAPTQP
jgi:hypothetical protein